MFKVIKNQKRRFGAAKGYVYCKVDGKPALATEHEAHIMLERARRNPEDLPFRAKLWNYLFGG